MAQNLHRTARGKLIDMNKLINEHELEVAVSNVRINARGDEVDPSGNIIRKSTHDHQVGSSKTPVHFHKVTPPVAPAPTAVPVNTAPAPVPAPVFESPNALMQPIPESKDSDKPAKGKQ